MGIASWEMISFHGGRTEGRGMTKRVERRAFRGAAKKVMGAVLALVLMVGLMPAVPASAYADESLPAASGAPEGASGKGVPGGFPLASQETSWDVSAAGDGSVVAVISQENGETVLSFKGSGAVRDFPDASAAPYIASYGDSITRAVVGDDITCIGAYALSLPRLRVFAGGATLSLVADNALEGATSLVAADLSRCVLTSVGENAFGGAVAEPAIERTVYVADEASAREMQSYQSAGAAKTCVAALMGSAIPAGASFEGGSLVAPERDGYTFVTWTSDAQLMHPEAGWTPMTEKPALYAKLSKNQVVETPQTYQGSQGLDQTVTLLDASKLPSTVSRNTDVLFYGETSDRYDNRFRAALEGSERIVFAFGVGRGSNVNGGDGSYMRSFTLPYISVLDASGTTVASYDNGNGKLRLFSTVFDGVDGKTQGNTVTAMRIGLEVGALPAGTYTLRFGAGLGANNGKSFLGKNVDFQFEIGYSKPAPDANVDLPDGMYVNGEALGSDEAISLTPQASSASVMVVRGKRDVTSDYTGCISNTNVAAHAGTGAYDWNAIAGKANGEARLEVRTSSGDAFRTITVRCSGFSADASTVRESVSGPQGNGATIQLKGAGAITTAAFDETTNYFDNYLESPVPVVDASFSLTLGGPGSAWGTDRWDWDTFQAGLESNLRIVDSSGKTVARVGGGLSWQDLTPDLTVTLAVADGMLTAGSTYALVAGADLAGHNAAAKLMREVRWTFTVAPRDIATCDIADIPQQEKTGSEISPEVSVTYQVAGTRLYDADSKTIVAEPAQTRVLTLGSDFSVTYENNVEGPVATAVVKGQGLFGGVARKTFVISGAQTLEQLACGFSDVAAEIGATDDPSAVWYIDGGNGYLSYVATNKLITGYEGTTLFGLHDPITRAQLATILCRASGGSASSDIDTTGLSDLPDGMWYTGYVNWAYANGIVRGYGDGTFHPDAPITREEMAVMIANYAKYRGIDVSQAPSSALEAMADWREISDWAVSAYAWCASAGVLTGFEADGAKWAQPQRNAERIEAAKVITVLLRDVLK